MKSQRENSEESFNVMFLDTFNSALGWSVNGKDANEFWNTVRKG